MAKRNHKPANRRTHHRRRIGAVSHGSMMHTAETLGGLVIGSMVSTIVQRQFTSVNPKIISVAQIGLGLFMTRKPSPIMQGVGWGMAGAGAIGLSHEVGLIHGVEDMMSGMLQGDYNANLNAPEGQVMYNGNMMNGMTNDTTLSGMDNGDTLSGMQNGTTLAGAEYTGDNYFAPPAMGF